MKHIELIEHPHAVKVGNVCVDLPPNVIEDCIFLFKGEPIGFFMRKMPERMCQLADIANNEFRSKRVPKSEMKRAPKDGIDEKTGKYKYKDVVLQLSTIIGSVPPKPHMGRRYATISRVHQHKDATQFIKSMLLLAKEAELLIKEMTPNIYERQKKIFEQVPEKWKLGSLFTSSISNFNIAASYHKDTANIDNCVNVIITKRKNSIGGNLNVPDYDATIDQCDNSILVYPAWRNIHGVTPIIPTANGGYRNSLVFYPLKAFLNIEK